ncbi:MAG: hypothetical protein WA949_13150 [Phormidesmis sp.]
MDDWQKQFQDRLNAIADELAKETSEFFEEVSRETAKETEKVADQLIEASSLVIDEIDRVVGPTVRNWSDQIDQSLESGFFYLDQHLTPWIEEVTAPISRTVNPWLQNHPTCVGCVNYHGMMYGDEMMVCAMHPYGPETESCRDWESVWPEPQSKD